MAFYLHAKRTVNMVKFTCDKCGAELPSTGGEARLTNRECNMTGNITGDQIGGFEVKVWDICESCWKTVQEYLGKSRIIKNPIFKRRSNA